MIRDFVPIIGSPLNVDGDNLLFKGGKTPDPQQPEGERPMMGLYLTKQTFSGGSISAKFTFTQVSQSSCAEIVVFYDPATSNVLDAGTIAGKPRLEKGLREAIQAVLGKSQ